MSHFCIKLIRGEDARRIPHSEFYLGFHPLPSFAAFEKLVVHTFPDLNGKSFQVQYLDDEDDLITVSSDPELGEAARLASAANQKVVKFFVKEGQASVLGHAIDQEHGDAEEQLVSSPANTFGSASFGGEVAGVNVEESDIMEGKSGVDDDEADDLSLCSDGVLVEIPPPTSTERAADALMHEAYDAEAALEAVAEEIRQMATDVNDVAVEETIPAQTTNTSSVVAADVSQAICVPTLAAEAAEVVNANESNVDALSVTTAPHDVEHKSADDAGADDANAAPDAAPPVADASEATWPGMEEALAASLADALNMKEALAASLADAPDTQTAPEESNNVAPTTLVVDGNEETPDIDDVNMRSNLSPPPMATSPCEPRLSNTQDAPSADDAATAVIDLVAFDTATEDARIPHGYLFVNGAGGWANYTVSLPEQVADYKILVLMNSEESRPLNLFVNGRLLDDAFARDTTGSFWDTNQMQWFEYGPFTLGGGITRLRLDTSGFFPHIKTLKFVRHVSTVGMMATNMPNMPTVSSPVSRSSSSSSSASLTTAPVDSTTTQPTDSQGPEQQRRETNEIESILRALAVRLEASGVDCTEAADSAIAPPCDLLGVLCGILSNESNVAALQQAASSPVLTPSLAILARARHQGRNFLHACISALPAIFAVLKDLVNRAPDFLSVVAPILKYLSNMSQDTATTSSNTAASDAPKLPIHRNVICDGCDSGDEAANIRRKNALAQGTIDQRSGCIRGVRFKSAVVEDFDLCAVCEATGAWDVTHAPFLKINTPDKTPSQIICILNGDDRAHPRNQWRRCGGRRGGRRWNGRCGNDNKCHNQDWRAAALRHAASVGVDVVPSFRPEASTATATATVTTPQEQPTTPQEQPTTPQEQPSTTSTTLQSDTHGATRPKARFECDITLADGAVVPAGSSLLKIWRVANPGNTAWPEGCRVTCVGGARLGASDEGFPVPPLPPGEALDIEVKLRAPASAGRYTSYWRLQQPNGERFGHRFWLDITVQTPSGQLARQIRNTAQAGVDIAQQAVTAAGIALARQLNPSAQAPSTPQSTPTPEPTLAPSTVHSMSGRPLQPWRTERTQLEAMGFNDVPDAVLNECNGDVAAVVEKLLA